MVELIKDRLYTFGFDLDNSHTLCMPEPPA
eukprot:UN12930